MGMFDYLRCEMPLPDPAPPNGTVFQTKDVPTDQLYMENWRITSDGKLVHEQCDYETVIDPAAPLGFWQRRLNQHEVDVDHHGDVEFYHYSDSREWWSYVARFTDGRCSRIWLAEHRPPPLPAQDAAE